MKMAVKFPKFLLQIMMSIFILRFSNSVCSSSSNHDGNAGKHNTSDLPCFSRYAVELYFRDYASFSDSYFQEYILHKIPFNSDTAFSELSELDHHLLGEGSHRRIASCFRFSIHPDSLARFCSGNCEVIIIERLPSGVFADPFELERLVQRGVYKRASVFGDTNLELPSFHSNRSVVEVHLDSTLNNSADQQIMKEFKIEIPVHARYPPLDESGYSEVKFGDPDLFIRCKMHDELPAQSCMISPVTSSVNLQLCDVVWSIPAGIKAHGGMVSIVTFTSAVLSAALIIIASVKHSHFQSDARLKHS